MRVFLVSFLFLFGCFAAGAQQIPLNQSVQNRLNQLIMQSDTSVFTGFRAMNWLELEAAAQIAENRVDRQRIWYFGACAGWLRPEKPGDRQLDQMGK